MFRLIYMLLLIAGCSTQVVINSKADKANDTGEELCASSLAEEEKCEEIESDKTSPPTIAISVVVAGGGRNMITVDFPADTSDLSRVDIRRISGLNAPAASCDDGVVVKSYTSFVDATFEDDTGSTTEVFSYRVCAYDAAENLTSDNDMIAENIDPYDDPPIANAGSDSEYGSGDTVTLDARSSSDVDSSVLTYSWSQTSGTAVTLSSTSAAQPTFTVPYVSSPTTLVFSLVVSDETTTSAADSVTIDVLPAVLLSWADIDKLNFWRGHMDNNSLGSLASYLTGLSKFVAGWLYEKAFSVPATNWSKAVVPDNARWTQRFSDSKLSLAKRFDHSQSTVGTKVIIFGGNYQTGSTSARRNDVWAFDTADNSWSLLKEQNPSGTPGTDYPTARAQHSQSTIGTKIIVFGGRDLSNTYHNDVWAFDTVAKTWSLLKADDPTGVVDTDYPKRRFYSSQTSIGTKIYIFGGFDSTPAVRNDVWAFDTADNTWSKLKADDPGVTEDTDYPKRRFQSSLSAVNNTLVAFGGEVSGSLRRNDVWSFDTTNNTWTRLKANDPGGTAGTDYPERRSKHAQSTVGTKVIISGGFRNSGTNIYHNDVWAFETSNNTWSLLKANDSGTTVNVDYPSRRFSHSQSTVGTKVVIIGGQAFSSGTESHDVWSFNTSDNSWALLRGDGYSSDSTFWFLYNDDFKQSTVGTKLILSGGGSGMQSSNEIVAFDTATNLWSVLSPNDPAGTVEVDYPEGRAEHSQSSLNTKIIIFGGKDSSYAYRNDVWEFDTSNNTWGKLKADNPGATVDVDYPKARYAQAQSTVGTKIIVYGGYDSVDARGDVWAFDTSGNTWTKLKADNPGGTVNIDYPEPRAWASQSTLGTKIIIFGGAGDITGYLNDVWAFDTTDNSWTRLKEHNPAGTVQVDYPTARFTQAQSTVGNKIIISGGYNFGRWNDVWAFDTTDNSWTRLADTHTSDGVHSMKMRARHGQSTVGSKVFIVGGTSSNLDIWEFDPSTFASTKSAHAILEFNVAGIGSDLGDYLSLNLNATASGDNGLGATAQGIRLYAWNEAGNQFVELAAHTAASTAAGSISVRVPSNYKTAGDKFYFMLRGDYEKGTVGSSVDFEVSSLRLNVPYVP